MNKPNFKFAVALPIFNEEDNIEKAVRAINAVLETIPHDTKIIAVNDGSKDRSLEILNSLSEKLNIDNLLIVNHPENKGYGGACFSALEKGFQADLDYVLFMDCDLTQDPKYIRSFVPKMLDGYTMIKGSRYIKGGSVRGVEGYRKMFSYVGNIVASLFWNLPIKDFTNGFRAIRVDAFEFLQLKDRGFSVLMEEIYYLSFTSKNFTEVPYILTVRADNDGTSTFSYNYKVFYDYLKYPLLSFLRIKPDHIKKLEKTKKVTHENKLPSM